VAIGVNWAEVWAPVWKAVWTQEPPEPPDPEPEQLAQTPAGKASRRYFVEIDGQHFNVDSAQQAVELLQRARAIAEHQAEQKSERVTKQLKRKPVVPKVKIAAPDILVSPAIKAQVAPLIADITRLYDKAALNAEMRLLMFKAMRDEDDDEEDVLLLL
jgi:hypothetical protein